MTEGFKTLMDEVSADVMEIEWTLGLEVEPDDVTKKLQSHDKIATVVELLHMDEWRKGFLEMKSIPGGDAVKTVETEDLECYINLVDKAVALPKLWFF